MKCYYDLHIHSVLSPCADETMTPNNIVNMAKLKGLDYIAVTDHNIALNLSSLFHLCEENQVLLIPGVEVESKEGVHLLCYFEKLEQAESFGNLMFEQLPMINNREDIFGPQWVMDEKDEIKTVVSKLLIQSTPFSVEEIVDYTHRLEGIIFAAHINKKSHSILTHLGFIPNELQLDGVELNDSIWSENKMTYKNREMSLPTIINSDAHTIGNLSEAIHAIELSNKTIEAFFGYFRS